tara:strand:- start:25118 stop:25282 length:165 start_codon:yes stop_codon:yes gene_type:complete
MSISFFLKNFQPIFVIQKQRKFFRCFAVVLENAFEKNKLIFKEEVKKKEYSYEF